MVSGLAYNIANCISGIMIIHYNIIGSILALYRFNPLHGIIVKFHNRPTWQIHSGRRKPLMLPKNDILTKAKPIKLIIFDVDGVLSNGCIYLGDSGEEYKSFHVQDGLGIKLLQETGVTAAVISGRSSKLVEKRMKHLNVHHVYQGQRDKIPAYEDLLSQMALTPEEVAFMGDDILDLPLIRRVGLSITVPNGVALVREYAHWQITNAGGHGAAREVCDLIMEAQGTLHTIHQRYL